MKIEEKAKAYDELFTKAKQIYNKENDVLIMHTIEDLFPELKESEDEKIRKEIAFTLEYLVSTPKSALHPGAHYTVEEALAWLEKQGDYANFRDKAQVGDRITKNEAGVLVNLSQLERVAKPSEKQGEKTKFHEGDWIVNPRTGLIEHIKNVLFCGNNGNYEFESSSMSIDSVDNSFRLWTIQDAKDGDVLANDNEIVIFKENNFNQKDLSGCMFVHCSLRSKKGYWYTIGGINPSNYVPATKEQRDLLFQKMNEAGYEWDVKNQVMTRIEQKSTNSYCQENCKGFQETGKCFADEECKAKKEAEQKPIWSEDDETKRTALISLVKEIKNQPLKRLEDWDGYINWLQLLKDRVQPKQEWSKEDENNFKHLLDEIVCLSNNRNSANRLYYDRLVKFIEELKNRAQPREKWCDKDERMLDRLIAYFEKQVAFTDDDNPRYANWLKSLRPQNRWKPSNEQMEALLYHCSNGSVLSSLYNDLKKIKEL